MIRTLALIAAAAAAAPSAPRAQDIAAQPWDSIVAQARGQTVNWFMWGGSDQINAYVDSVGDSVLADYGITLNRVAVTDAAEVVNLVLAEKEAGNTDEGSVDMIWINGENFRAMKQAGLAWCGWVEALPNNRLIDWNDPSIANDFGVPVEGCEAPWNRVQFAFAYDSAVWPDRPRDMAGLLQWIRDHPGQFTYPAPPDFNGSAFVRHVFIHAAGGPETLLGPFDQARFDAVAPRAWAILNELEPSLWRKGATYPTSITQLQQLFANREVGIVFDYDPAQFGLAVEAGTYPDTVRSFGLEDGTIGNTNYVLIPFNSPRKAAAMVLANELISGEQQLLKADPAVWGASPAIDVARADPVVRDGFAALPRHPSVIPATELAKAALPELQADWLTAIEAGWKANVGR